MSRVRQLLNPELLAMQAYAVPAAQNLIKLDAMENPYGLPEALQAGWLAGLREVPLNRYPDAAASSLRQKLQTVMQVPAGLDVLLGNGSDELIQMLALAVAAPGRVLMTPEPGFAMYRLISRFVGLDYQPLTLCADDFSLSRDAALAAIDRHQPALIFLAMPNNPTGNLFQHETVIAIIEAAPGLVVIDEAYHAFAGTTFMQSLPAYDNLLLLRTLSKSGLAGLRLGYLVGAPEWLHELNKLRLPYNINALTQYSTGYILDHHELLEQQAAEICRQRQDLLQELQAMQGITVWPSDANFLLFRCTGKPATDIHEALRQRGILIKNLHGSQPGLDQCLRVTVGNATENRSFLTALGELL